MLVRLSTLALAAGLLSTPSLVAALSASEIPADTDISALLASAQSHLSKGETHDALAYYDAAIERYPASYLTFFKRATTYLSLGRTTQATDDFRKVLELKPGFEGAHAQLGKIKARSADWDGAEREFRAAKKDDELARLTEAKGAAVLAQAAANAGHWDECVSQAAAAIMVANRAIALRELRARCHFEQGSIESGLSDLQHILNMRPGDVTPHITISANTFYTLGDLQGGMAAIRKCLISDQDNKTCKRILKQEKAVDKLYQKTLKSLERNQPTTAVRNLVPTADDEGLIREVKAQIAALQADGIIPPAAPSALVRTLVEIACRAYYESSSKRAKEYCDESLSLDEDSLYGLLYKAKALLDADEFEASIQTLKKASEAHPDKSGIVNPLMQKAQVALKRSKTKDYYKVLGVAHDSDERQIKSAYRKLSKVHHPDKAAQQGITKEDAEKKMAAINEAYEVLSDPELRARFDRGDDPNNHEQPQHGGFHGNPFGGGGGNPFMFQQGGGGQQFKFQYGSGGFPGGFPFGG